MLFDGDGLTYRDLKSMDMAEYYELSLIHISEPTRRS